MSSEDAASVAILKMTSEIRRCSRSRRFGARSGPGSGCRQAGFYVSLAGYRMSDGRWQESDDILAERGACGYGMTVFYVFDIWLDVELGAKCW
jgi:hypothetical protein